MCPGSDADCLCLFEREVIFGENSEFEGEIFLTLLVELTPLAPFKFLKETAIAM